MQNQVNLPYSKPILKHQRPPIRILSILPQPPTQHREPPDVVRAIAPTKPAVGVNLTLHQAIDYDKLTPTQQARWDAGMYGSIELKARGIYHYYYLRWLDPTSRRYRSTYLGKDWDKAVAKVRSFINPVIV